MWYLYGCLPKKEKPTSSCANLEVWKNMLESMYSAVQDAVTYVDIKHEIGGYGSKLSSTAISVTKEERIPFIIRVVQIQETADC